MLPWRRQSRRPVICWLPKMRERGVSWDKTSYNAWYTCLMRVYSAKFARNASFREFAATLQRVRSRRWVMKWLSNVDWWQLGPRSPVLKTWQRDSKLYRRIKMTTRMTMQSPTLTQFSAQTTAKVCLTNKSKIEWSLKMSHLCTWRVISANQMLSCQRHHLDCSDREQASWQGTQMSILSIWAMYHHESRRCKSIGYWASFGRLWSL